MKRSGKFYRKNEAEVMEMLGFDPTPNSGSGWVVKEDGQNDRGICQLKSTDANSIKVNLKDLQTLEYNASVTHKVPVFAIQFLGTNDIWLMVKPEYLQDATDIITMTPKDQERGIFVGVDLSDTEDISRAVMTKVKSSSNSREKFHKEREMKYRKDKSAR